MLPENRWSCSSWMWSSGRLGQRHHLIWQRKTPFEVTITIWVVSGTNGPHSPCPFPTPMPGCDPIVEKLFPTECPLSSLTSPSIVVSSTSSHCVSGFSDVTGIPWEGHWLPPWPICKTIPKEIKSSDSKNDPFHLFIRWNGCCWWVDLQQSLQKIGSPQQSTHLYGA